MKSTYDQFMTIFEKRGLENERKKLVSKSLGQVLEIGVGTGINLTHYGVDQVQHLTLTDYDLNKIIQSKINAMSFQIPYKLLASDVMSLPFETKQFDTVVCTLVFCSVQDVTKGLKEIKRVLKDEGQLIFIEHVLPEEKHLRTAFNLLTPIWKRVASNCHLNRDYLTALTQAGFQYTLNNRFFKTAFISGIATKGAPFDTI